MGDARAGAGVPEPVRNTQHTGHHGVGDLGGQIYRLRSPGHAHRIAILDGMGLRVIGMDHHGAPDLPRFGEFRELMHP